MATIRLENITKKFGDITALQDLSFEVKDGEFFCILGPPGAGKTTTLRTILGLEKPDEGNIYVDNEAVNKVHPSKRDIAMIFQNLALYPDKTIFNNIASPLRRMELSEEEIEEKVTRVAEQLKIDWLLEKTPAQLSGGERQRVAIGRAIVRQPVAYLMDEPLANLDAKLRLEMRVSLKELQTNLGETFLYVTHDQVEALSMADRIAILNSGMLQQVGVPDQVYREPNNIFVAKVLGNPSMNLLECRINESNGTFSFEHASFSVHGKKQILQKALNNLSAKDSGVVLGIRPEDVLISLSEPGGSSIAAEIYVTEPLGNKTIVDIKLGDEVIKVIEKPGFKGEPEQRVWLKLREHKLHLFDGQTGTCIYHAAQDSPLLLGESH